MKKNEISNGKKLKCYLAGPMRGFSLFNFPEFDRFKRLNEHRGWEVVSPADLDRASGFDPGNDKYQGLYAFADNCESWPAGMDPIKTIQRNLDAIMDPELTAMAMMPGWWLSVGAMQEYYLARMRGLFIFDADTGDDIEASSVETLFAAPESDPYDVDNIEQVFDKSESKDICIEAMEITSGDRNEDYGDPSDDMRRIAQMWSGYLGTKITMFDIPILMNLLKMSRERHKPKRDNMVDGVGYLRIYQLMREGKRP